jgi:hypothetical protein
MVRDENDGRVNWVVGECQDWGHISHSLILVRGCEIPVTLSDMVEMGGWGERIWYGYTAQPCS